MQDMVDLAQVCVGLIVLWVNNSGKRNYSAV